MRARSGRGMAAAAVMALLAMSVSNPAMAAPRSDPPNKDVQWMAGQPIVSSTLVHGLRSPFVRPTLLLVGSSCQWQAAMAGLVASHSLEAGAEAEPAVDWNLQSVVVVALGSMPYGYDVGVVGAKLSQGKLLLDVHVDYQSYENNLENVTPLVVLVADVTGINEVQATYDLNPGLPSVADAPACPIQRSLPHLGSSDGDRNPGLVVAGTWGSLKSSYR